jgi:hypothetical protein
LVKEDLGVEALQVLLVDLDVMVVMVRQVSKGVKDFPVLRVRLVKQVTLGAMVILVLKVIPAQSVQ